MATKKEQELIRRYVEDLSCDRRRRRQDASHELAQIAKTDSHELVLYVEELIDALYRPEAQTRWEILDALSDIALKYPDEVKEAYEAAEISLYDEDSATVRLSAFHYLCVVGASSQKRSEAAWKLLDGAVQCYHGDPEYRDMLTYLMDFVQGDISDATKKSLASRVEFDAKNGRGYIKAFSSDIYDIAGSVEID